MTVKGFENDAFEKLHQYRDLLDDRLGDLSKKVAGENGNEWVTVADVEEAYLCFAKSFRKNYSTDTEYLLLCREGGQGSWTVYDTSFSWQDLIEKVRKFYREKSCFDILLANDHGDLYNWESVIKHNSHLKISNISSSEQTQVLKIVLEHNRQRKVDLISSLEELLTDNGLRD